MPSELSDLVAQLVAIDSVNPPSCRAGRGRPRPRHSWPRGAAPRASRWRRRAIPRARASCCARPGRATGARSSSAATWTPSGGSLRRCWPHATRPDDEEDASTGIQDVLRTVRADAAVVTEPTELEVVVAHKAFVWSEIEVTGRAAHGSRPALGVDAIVRAGPVLVELGRLDETLGARTHPLLGRGSVHASAIEGGGELSSYPARCLVKLERRTLPGETVPEVERELDELLGRCPDLLAERRTLLSREPLEIDPGHEIVGTLRRAAAAVTGAEPAIGGASYWADSGLIAAAGIPTVLFGPGGEGAHAAEERVSLRGTEAVARTLVETAARFCR